MARYWMRQQQGRQPLEDGKDIWLGKHRGLLKMLALLWNLLLWLLKHSRSDKSRKHPSRGYLLSTGEKRRSLEKDWKVTRPKDPPEIPTMDDKIQETSMTLDITLLVISVKKGAAKIALGLDQQIETMIMLLTMMRPLKSITHGTNSSLYLQRVMSRRLRRMERTNTADEQHFYDSRLIEYTALYTKVPIRQDIQDVQEHS
jgi:hypothetical protein